MLPAVRFRNDIYDQYKANRARDCRTISAPQFALVREATEAFGVCQIEMADYEADDLIATYARHAVEAGAEVTIVSSDKDMMQLVDRRQGDDARPDHGTGRSARPRCARSSGSGPDKVIDVQALCGDSIDNVPGVPGIGVKTAAELINTYGDLETLLARARRDQAAEAARGLIDNEAKARLSKELVKLDDEVPLPCPLSALRVKPLDLDQAVAVSRRDGVARARDAA